MTDEPTAVEMLVNEVNELLSAASVGLYEFLWLLRSSVPDASDSQRREYAREALCQVLGMGGVRLILLEWPNEAELGEVEPEDVRETAWEDPVEGKPYVAVARC